MSRMIYVNGDFLNQADAKVSVLDRGFLFADAVYEVTTILDGKLIDNAAHLSRLHRSLGELRMRAPLTDEQITEAQNKLIELNGVEQGGLYLQISRGVAERDFAFPGAQTHPTVVMFTQEKNILDDPMAQRGIKVITMPDLRWKRRDIKTVGLLGPSLAKQAALEAGADDAWMVEDGFITEGSSNNAYIVTANGEIKTRQLGNEILSGITRSAVLRLCTKTQQKIVEQAFSVDEAMNAAEAFITSASTFVLPVVSIDGVKIGTGEPGPTALRLRALYIEIARERQCFDHLQ